MKKILLIASILTLTFACQEKKENTQNEIVTSLDTLTFQVFGDSIQINDAISKEEMLAKYQSMKNTDTLYVKFYSKIKKTCGKKGCWMTMDLGEANEVFVRFKDYSFFVPTQGAEDYLAVASGKAFIEETPIDQLKHEAKDAGESQAHIDSITSPKVNYRFEADGVLIATSK